jgi:hypothetical protein
MQQCSMFFNVKLSWWDFNNKRCMMGRQGMQERVDEEGLLIPVTAFTDAAEERRGPAGSLNADESQCSKSSDCKDVSMI